MAKVNEHAPHLGRHCALDGHLLTQVTVEEFRCLRCRGVFSRAERDALIAEQVREANLSDIDGALLALRKVFSQFDDGSRAARKAMMDAEDYLAIRRLALIGEQNGNIS